MCMHENTIHNLPTFTAFDLYDREQNVPGVESIQLRV